ncbi:MAG: MBL fold metallo-hydrolase [Candidatus Anstonellales archaeon]
MEIFFVGVGGGRINLIRQVKGYGTGGFAILGSTRIYVDPGPGAIVKMNEFGISPTSIHAVIATHNHIDHVSDANVLIEGMSAYGNRKKGIIIGSKSVIYGDGNGDRGITKYHQNFVKEIHVAEWGKKENFEGFEIEYVKAVHDDESTFGFKLRMDGKTVGYTSDGNFYEGIGKNYSGCNVLIINTIKPTRDTYPKHFSALVDGVEILKEAKPKLAILYHYGMKMIKAGPAYVANQVEKKTGVKTISVKDGARIGSLFIC